MSRRIAIAMFSVLLLLPTVVRADAVEDLAAGRKALLEAKLDEAATLLSAAAQALPNSVEAQLALADCQLRLGEVDQALKQYQAVVKLSPDHAHAKRMVATLTGQRTSLEKQIAAAQALMEVAAFDRAAVLLTNILREPDEPAQRNAARLLLAEAKLMSQDTLNAKAEALQVVQDSEDAAQIRQARVIAALALVLQSDRQIAAAKKLIDQAAELQSPWKERAQVATALAQLEDESKAIQTSQLLSGALDAFPPSVLRRAIVSRGAVRLMYFANVQIAKGEMQTAMKIVWPMISSQLIPPEDAALKPLNFTGGWLFTSPERKQLQKNFSALIAKIGGAKFDPANEETSLLYAWLAVETLRQFPDAVAHQTLLLVLAERYAALGEKEFQRTATAVVANPNPAVNRFHVTALTCYSQIAALYPDLKRNESVIAKRDSIVEFYASARQWEPTIAALAILYAADAEELKWQTIRLRVRQANNAEDRLISARRALGQELSPGLKAALAEVVKTLGDDADKRTRGRAIAVVDPLVARYASLGRVDLSDAVMAAVVADDDAELADWALWLRAHFVGQRAATALASSLAQTNDANALKVEALHTAEIKLLNELISKHPSSDFADDAVRRVTSIADGYRHQRAFTAARTVLADFLKAQPNLAAKEDIEFRLATVSVSQANVAFAERKDQTTPPSDLLPEHAAAIDALAAFLKTHPTGDFSTSAEDELFLIAQVYGQADAWPVTRKVLDLFAAAVPNFRSPAHLKWLQAATYLGELDRDYGLSLLSPMPRTRPTSRTDPETALAMNGTGFGGGGLGGFGYGKQGGQFGGGKGGAYAGPAPDGAALPGTPLPVDPTKIPAGDYGGIATTPSESSLAMIRESQQRQYKRIAMLEGEDESKPADNDEGSGDVAAGIALPSGMLLSEAELKRQEDAADKAYAILIELVKSDVQADEAVAAGAREQVFWMFGFFENQLRADRAIVLLQRYLQDHAAEPDRVALAYRAVTDRLVWVRQRKPGEKIDQAWVNARHQLFEQARKEIAAFIAANAEKTYRRLPAAAGAELRQDATDTWANAARMLTAESFQQESQLVRSLSPERASGLLVQSAEAIMALLKTAPSHPQANNFPNQVWNLADQVAALGQNEQAIYLLRRITLKFPTHALANQSLVRIAQLYAANLSNPLRAIETYQEYLNRTDGDPAVPTAIFNIAAQLAAQKRYLEALHVYGVFVDSFPTDQRAAAALHAIGQTHQSNGAWQEALKTYDRIFEEYAEGAVIPQVKLDVAECRINLGEWSVARRLYEEYLEKYPKHGKASMATARLEVLKKLDRYQDLLADNEIDRNKDDAQFQIGQTVLQELQNPVKAVEEFRKVVKDYPKSDVSDDAQTEIGKALLSLGRLEEGRAELLKVPSTYQNSPLADDALFLVGKSYEQQAQQLAGVTAEKAREESFAMQQGDAYARFNKDVAERDQRSAELRGQFKLEGNQEQVELNDANFASRLGSVALERLYCEVTHAELQAETETALQIANRQDRIHDAYRQAVVMYQKAATDYPLGDKTDQSLLRIAQIIETELKDRPAAMQTYEKIVKLFPGTPVAEDAAWKVTQFHVEEGRYAQAAESYKHFIRNYPGSARVADAQFGFAEVLEQLGQWVDAMDAYEVFRQKFGKHAKVKLASEQITWIKTYRK